MEVVLAHLMSYSILLLWHLHHSTDAAVVSQEVLSINSVYLQETYHCIFTNSFRHSVLGMQIVQILVFATSRARFAKRVSPVKAFSIALQLPMLGIALKQKTIADFALLGTYNY